jgi:serine/threonine protein kinase
MEYFHLSSKIISKNTNFSCYFWLKIVKGLKALHGLQIYHRDLKVNLQNLTDKCYL